MAFIGLLGWVIATFLIGFMLGLGVGARATTAKKVENDQKVTEK